MPSDAYKNFRVHSVTVNRLLEAHRALTDNNRGKKALSHLTRSGIVMLCACWEDYVESLLQQSLSYLAYGVSEASLLPIETRKFLSLKIKEDKNELSPLLLADRNWVTKLLELCNAEIEALNTPKSGNLNKLYKRYLGVTDFSSMWSMPAKDIDDFVTLRGGIAHKGKAEYVKPSRLLDLLNSIKTNCMSIDSAMCDYLHLKVGGTIQPWRKATK